MDVDEFRFALALPDVSVRHRATLIAGSTPNPDFIPLLIDQCRSEPDFFVRDMLTWALINQDRARVVQALLPELESPLPQARAQALHTVSKLNDTTLWPVITDAHLLDSDDEVARTAWRAAARMVPLGQEAELAALLATQFARGNRDVQLSLSKALAALAPHSLPVIKAATANADEVVRVHALATEGLLRRPEAGYDVAIDYAYRVLAQKGAPTPPDAPIGTQEQA